MTPDDVAAFRYDLAYLQSPKVRALCDALEAAWAEQAALARVVYLGATETEQAVIDAAREWVDNEDCIGDCGCGACDQLHDAVRALDSGEPAATYVDGDR